MKYVLCVSQAGLNDLLCEIERCWRYAERHDRTLLLDTTKSGLHDHFWTYFDVISGSIEVTSPDYTKLNHLTTFPPQLQGRLGLYVSAWCGSGYVDAETQTLLQFDFDQDYDADVLVYEHFWKGDELLSIFLLSRLQLQPAIASEIRSRLPPDNYVCVHVRNTDYRTEYRSFLSSIRQQVADKKVVICSDDSEVIEVARLILDKSRVSRLSTFVNTGGRPLHSSPVVNQYELNVQTLTDLFCLACSQKIFATSLSSHPGTFSGFVLLARKLQDSPSVIRSLFGSLLSSGSEL